MKVLLTLVTFFILLICLPLYAESTLKLRYGNTEKVFTLSELLRSPMVETITVEHDPALANKSMSYRAIPLRELFKGIDVLKDEMVQFRCLDGFTGPLSSDHLFRSTATPYLALETTTPPWPPLKVGEKKTAGPFYLVWKNHSEAGLGADEWPYQIVEFEVPPAIEKKYPHIVPAKVSSTSAVYLGYQVFVKNCFSCHSFNLEGGAHVGPDLNIPLSPTEYWNEKYLVKFIRNSQSVRHWVNDGMRTFDEATVSKAELENLLSYFRYMSKQRKQ